MERPHTEVEDWLERYVGRLERRIDALSSRSNRLSNARLALVLGGALVGYVLYSMVGERAGGAFLILIVILFTGLAVWHGRIEASAKRHRFWREIKLSHLARSRLDWDALPPCRVEVPDYSHPFEADLNLTGRRSLLQLLDTTATRGGHALLLKRLRAQLPPAAEIIRRQRLVRAFSAAGLLRDRLSLEARLLAEQARDRTEEDLLAQVAYQHPVPTRPILVLLSALAVVNVVFVLLHVAGVAGYLWAFSFPIYAVVYLTQYGRLSGLFERAEDLYYDLRRYAVLFARIENHRFRDSDARALCSPIQDADRSPSLALRRAARVAAAAGTQKSEILTLVLNAIGPWDVVFARRLETVKDELRRQLPAWLDAWHEIEVLSAIATFATLNPETTFPEPEGSEALITCVAIGHPLIRTEERVTNDFRLERPGEICLMTGSNMSGKSTFLRTVGINLVLAGLGAPVIARQFMFRRVRLFTCLQVSDSVNDGISYFYAEVRRLRDLLDAARMADDEPLIFLIDEIFRGTNNRERLQGSRAYIRALARERAAGLIATHDLELVRLETEIPNLRNAHFRESIADGRMVFDYRLRTGPSPTTNALILMEMEGLPVDP